jgi:uncharacterized membrane protein HdeD (DUF308 family)
MIDTLSRYWWLLAIRGVAAILFGIAAFLWPAITLAVLVLLFGAYSLVDGIFAVIAGIATRKEQERWWMMILEGLAGIVIGVITFLYPGITALILLYFIAAWSIVTGAFEVAAAIRLRKEIEGEWLLGLAGFASILFGADRLLRDRLRRSDAGAGVPATWLAQHGGSPSGGYRVGACLRVMRDT